MRQILEITEQKLTVINVTHHLATTDYYRDVQCVMLSVDDAAFITMVSLKTSGNVG